MKQKAHKSTQLLTDLLIISFCCSSSNCRHQRQRLGIMSASPVVLAQPPAVEDDMDRLETAFSRLPKESLKKKRAYGSAMDADTPQGKENSDIMNSTDLLSMSMTQSDHRKVSLFSDIDDDGYPSDVDPGNDMTDNDDETVEMFREVSKSNEESDCEEEELVAYQSSESGEENDSGEQENQGSAGRQKNSLRTNLEPICPPTTPVKSIQETAVEEAPTKEAMTATQEKASPTKADITSDEAPERRPLEEIEPEEAPTAKDQPDQESLITSIDNLFVHADKATVTVRDIVRSLEAEYDVKFEKPTKTFVKSHLTDLIKGHVEPTVESTEPMEESEEEEEEESILGDSESSDYEDEDEENKKKQELPKKSVKPKKRTSARRAQAKKKPSHVRIHAEMLRKRRIEELKVRNEELQLKQSKEDQQRAEQIAAKFETNTEELRHKRLEDRLDLLLKLDQKRIQVINVDLMSAKITTEVTKKDDQVPSSTPTEESDSEDDFELEIIGKDEPVSKSLPKAVGVKSSALSMLDMVCCMKPDANKKSKEHRSPGKTMTARATLRNVLLAKQRKAGNMWLARELGYKTEEDHLRDCMLVEHKKREVVVKKEEERVRANERKQLRERLMTESSPYDAGDKEAPNDVKSSGDEGDESDEEVAMAREIEKERQAEDSPRDSFNVLTNTDNEMNQPGEESEEDNGDDNVDGGRQRVTESLTEERTVSGEGPFSTDVVWPDAVMEVGYGEVDSNGKSGAVNGDRTTADDIPSEHLAMDTEDVSSPVQASKLSEDASKAMDSVPVPSFEATAGSEDNSDPFAMEDDDENEFQKEDPEDADTKEESKDSKVQKDKNAGWKAMLQKEAEKIKKMKSRTSGNGLVEAEADEEEEEEIAGLEDFGFSLHKKKTNDEEEDDIDADKLTEEDLKHVVDDVSDDEGDEEAGETARKELEQKEEKERHKEIIRRMRDGYDGRRGGIAGGGVGARGIHRFDELVAADNRDDAKRLGLLNDDELDSDDDGEKGDSNDDEIDDENALLDKMLKDRFLHRSSNDEIGEKFSDDEEEEEGVSDGKSGYQSPWRLTAYIIS
jgi:hypothetical protein